jgi:uncharacterized membrane protein YbaN (DUF454 family)
MRYIYLTLGLLFVATGVIGAFLPVLPTTPFLLLAIWCLSRSNPRLEAWLLNHPKYGASLRAWREHRVVPRRAKISAAGLMTMSFLILVFFTSLTWLHLAIIGLTMFGSGLYVCTRPETPKLMPRNDATEAAQKAHVAQADD